MWRYFSITDEGKAICKICEQAVSPGGQKGKTTKTSRRSYTRGAGYS